MTAIRRFRLPRFVAAALAALGLLASSARTMLACTMPSEDPVVAVAADDPHAHHHGGAAVGAEAALDQGATVGDERIPASEHERCPDLAHCVVLAWTALPPGWPVSTPVPEARVDAVDVHPLSAGRTIDTPPPKRG